MADIPNILGRYSASAANSYLERVNTFTGSHVEGIHKRPLPQFRPRDIRALRFQVLQHTIGQVGRFVNNFRLPVIGNITPNTSFVERALFPRTNELTIPPPRVPTSRTTIEIPSASRLNPQGKTIGDPMTWRYKDLQGRDIVFHFPHGIIFHVSRAQRIITYPAARKYLQDRGTVKENFQETDWNIMMTTWLQGEQTIQDFIDLFNSYPSTIRVIHSRLNDRYKIYHLVIKRIDHPYSYNNEYQQINIHAMSDRLEQVFGESDNTLRGTEPSTSFDVSNFG